MTDPRHGVYTGNDRKEVELENDGQWYAGELRSWGQADDDFLRREIRVRRQVQAQTRATTRVVPPTRGRLARVYVSDELVELLSVHARDVAIWANEGWMFGVGVLLNRNSAGHLCVRPARRSGSMPTPGTTCGTSTPPGSCGRLRRGDGPAGLGALVADDHTHTYSHLWPKAEDRTRTAAASLWVTADTVLTTGAGQAAEQHVQR